MTVEIDAVAGTIRGANGVDFDPTVLYEKVGTYMQYDIFVCKLV